MKRTFRYRPDGTSYEVTPGHSEPLTAAYIGDRTAEKRAAARGQVPVQEAGRVADDAVRNRQHEFRKQRPERIRQLVEAAKRHSSWL